MHLKRPARDGTGVSGARCSVAGSMTTCRAHFWQWTPIRLTIRNIKGLVGGKGELPPDSPSDATAVR